MTKQVLAATDLPTINEIKDAQQLVYAIMSPTPQIVWPLLCERLGAEVWVKHENHTPIGAFKARTAVVYTAELFRTSANISGLVTATRGNHGQSGRTGREQVQGAGARRGAARQQCREKRRHARPGSRSHRVWQRLPGSEEHAQKLADHTAGTLFPRIIATSSKAWLPIGWSSSPQWPIWMLSTYPSGRDRVSAPAARFATE